jgi:hypothetical protein
MLRFLPICLLLGWSPNSLWCQPDSLSKKKINVDVVFGADRLFRTSDQRIHLPENIQFFRSFGAPFLRNATTYTDIPQFHASVFAGLLTRVDFAKGYRLNVDIISEDRGQSFGGLNLSKTIVYPRIYGTIEESFSVFNRAFIFNAKLGDLLRHQNNFGLTYHNIDVQGMETKLSSGPWWTSFSLIGDMSQHVGLNVEEAYSYKAGVNKKMKAGYSILAGTSLDQFFLLRSHGSRLRNLLSLYGSVKRNRVSYFVELGYSLEMIP